MSDLKQWQKEYFLPLKGESDLWKEDPRDVICDGCGAAILESERKYKRAGGEIHCEECAKKAASPHALELLEACEAALNFLEAVFACEAGESKEIADQLRIAIAKAKGGEGND